VKAQTDHEFVEQSWLRKTKDFAEGVRSVAEAAGREFYGELARGFLPAVDAVFMPLSS